MSSKDKPIFDNTRFGNTINYELDYYNDLYSESKFQENDTENFDSYYEDDDSDYLKSYCDKMKKKSAEFDSESDSE